MFYEFRRQQQLDFPVYIGGLSSKMTEVYDRRANQTRRQWPRLQLMQDVAPFVLNGQTINDSPARPGRIYALSSGMMTPKTLSNIFARRLVGVPQHSILFVGYADPESPGGILRSAKIGDSVSLDPDEPSQTVRCHIEQFQFSAHASRESLDCLRDKSRAEENSARARRSAGSGMDAGTSGGEFRVRCGRADAGRELRIVIATRVIPSAS